MGSKAWMVSLPTDRREKGERMGRRTLISVLDRLVGHDCPYFSYFTVPASYGPSPGSNTRFLLTYKIKSAQAYIPRNWLLITVFHLVRHMRGQVSLEPIESPFYTGYRRIHLPW